MCPLNRFKNELKYQFFINQLRSSNKTFVRLGTETDAGFECRSWAYLDLNDVSKI